MIRRSRSKISVLVKTLRDKSDDVIGFMREKIAPMIGLSHRIVENTKRNRGPLRLTRPGVWQSWFGFRGMVGVPWHQGS